jgi:CheY-like chemotaxis protein
MEGGGVLTISTACTEEKQGGPDLEPGAYVCVTVADTGAGMPPGILARAIEPFFSTKPMGKGTGLGLAQVYGIARQSGGTLRIESEVGRGTIVHLLVPAASAEEAEDCRDRIEEAQNFAPSPAADATVLVIDDDSDVRAFLADSLQSLGYKVIDAEGGEEGLKQLDERPPDLVLLDYAMPGMHGADVARAARAKCPDLPIIFVTGYAESQQLEAALGANVPVLRKPFNLAQLAAAVQEQLSAKNGSGGALESGKIAS